jgi:hypothetical protein
MAKVPDVQHEGIDSLVIDRLGGAVATGRLCEVTPQAVSQWRRDGIPKARRMYLQMLRPDAFEAQAASEESARAA